MPADSVLVLQHQDDAGPGNLATWLHDNGVSWQLADVSAGPLPVPQRHRALVVLGSRESAYDTAVGWIPPEREFIRAEIDHGTPVLGICFGAQLLAQVLGGEVRAAAEAERGWTDITAAPAVDPRLADVVSGRWFEWHGDEILLPPGAVQLARTHCLQAFGHGRHLGVQFHPEVTATQIRRWLADDRRRGQLSVAGREPDDLLRATAAVQPQAEQAAGRLYREFLQPARKRPAGVS